MSSYVALVQAPVPILVLVREKGKTNIQETKIWVEENISCKSTKS